MSVCNIIWEEMVTIKFLTSIFRQCQKLMAAIIISDEEYQSKDGHLRFCQYNLWKTPIAY